MEDPDEVANILGYESSYDLEEDLSKMIEDEARTAKGEIDYENYRDRYFDNF
jgi:hypothetical protein